MIRPALTRGSRTALTGYSASPCRHQLVTCPHSRAESRRLHLDLGAAAQTRHRHQQRSRSGHALVFGALVTASLCCFAVATADPDRLDSWSYIAPAHEYVNPDMPTQIAPGRLGSLTIDEKVKLQEAWLRLGKICGFSLDDDEDEADEAASTAVADKTDAKEKKKSKRFKLGRKKTDPVSVEQQEEDKYGQKKEFQQALKENSPEDIRETVWTMVKMDHPDALVLRFLRARKWDVDKALIMMIATMNWRKREMHIEDTVVHQGESVALKETPTKDDEGFLEQYRMGKSFMHGVDKDGRPICIIRARLHSPGQQTMRALEEYMVHTIETARMALRDPVDTATLIFDMTGFGLKNMDQAPVRFMIKCFEANYPESLGVVAVHNAPWVFQGIWKLVRGWLDPVVAAKINFTSSTEDLEAFIPRKNILKEFGGDDEWEYKYVEPTADENEKLGDTETRDRMVAERQKLVERFENKTKEWLKYAPTEPEHDKLQAERDEIAEALRVDYWKLDPYLRAKSLYDRTGVINDGGKIVIYPYRDGSEKMEGLAGAGHVRKPID